jgi:DNA-binding response OmpR family regulator
MPPIPGRRRQSAVTVAVHVSVPRTIPHGTVLVVEDSPAVRELVSTLLERAGYRVLGEADGEAALARFSSSRPDVVLLDVNLPGMSGWQVLTRLRERSGVPIAMLTGLADDTSKVRALNNGADDYLVKSASSAELVARVGALLRRARRPRDLEVPVYDDGVVRVDFELRRVQVEGTEVQLTPLEYRLLSAFVRHPNQILSRDRLLREVWHDETGGPSDHVKTYVGYLRRKLRVPGAGEELPIETVRGFGYRWRNAA